MNTVPSPVERIRTRDCQACPTPCDSFKSQSSGLSFLKDPCAGCPLSPPMWGPHGCDPSAVPPPTVIRPPSSDLTGLGDAFHKAALPIGRAIHWPCVDPKTQELRPASPCAKIQRALNKAVPFRS